MDGVPIEYPGSSEIQQAEDLARNMPDEIKQLVSRCEINEQGFCNDDMSVALKFGEMLWRRLAKVADYYEKQSSDFMPGDIRGPMMAKAAEDMRHVLRDTRKDL